jgi:hypothetical protein
LPIRFNGSETMSHHVDEIERPSDTEPENGGDMIPRSEVPTAINRAKHDQKEHEGRFVISSVEERHQQQQQQHQQ